MLSQLKVIRNSFCVRKAFHFPWKVVLFITFENLEFNFLFCVGIIRFAPTSKNYLFRWSRPERNNLESVWVRPMFGSHRKPLIRSVSFLVLNIVIQRLYANMKFEYTKNWRVPYLESRKQDRNVPLQNRVRTYSEPNRQFFKSSYFKSNIVFYSEISSGKSIFY